jgi:hypothetical protein
MKIKHSKYKNTGILFELLTRQITSETIKGETPKAINVLRKFFNKNTQLLKEYQIYSTLLNQKYKDSNKATILLETCLDAHKEINKSLLRREKFNLVKEIKKVYNAEDFFNAKIDNYKILASTYILLENQANPIVLTNSKVTIVEHIIGATLPNKPKTEMVMEEYEKFDKSTRLLTYKILLEKFNEKYTNLSDSQKTLLKEYVYNVSNSPKLKSFVNEEIVSVKSQLSHLVDKVVDPVVKIKINEVANILQPLCKKSSVHDDNIINLLNYYELVNELDSVHGKA